jgi:hypothetical protein
LLLELVERELAWVARLRQVWELLEPLVRGLPIVVALGSGGPFAQEAAWSVGGLRLLVAWASREEPKGPLRWPNLVQECSIRGLEGESVGPMWWRVASMPGHLQLSM